MSLRSRGSQRSNGQRTRVDVNENTAPYSSNAESSANGIGAGNHTTDDVDADGSGIERRHSKWDRAFDLIGALPSQQLSSAGGDSSFDRPRLRSVAAAGSIKRQPSIWNALANEQTRRRLLSRQSSMFTDPEAPDGAETMTEEEVWEKCQTIREMAASMAMKRQRKAELMKAKTLRLSGYNALMFHKNIIWRARKEKFINFLKQFKIWHSTFKMIDGQFGMGVGSYFRFMIWLLFLNIFIMIVLIGVLIVPQAVFSPHSFHETISALNLTDPEPIAYPAVNDTITADQLISQDQMNYIEEALVCTQIYNQKIENLTKIASIPDQIANFLQGKGFPEQTFVFYGHYFNKTYFDSFGETDAVYIMPLAYILATGAYFILSLVMMVRNSARGFKDNFVDRQSRYFQYSCKVFTAWDYCMTRQKACRQKHNNLYREFKLDMENERIHIDRQNRTLLAKFGLVIIRFFINLFVIVTLCAAGVAIYYTNEKSLEWSNTFSDELVLLIIQYLPSLCITALNAIIPLIFIFIVQPEDYSAEFEIKITLVRTVFLRLSSLAVLIASLYSQIAQCSDDDYKCGNCGEIQCWETYVGQQFFKLAIMDLLINIAVVIFYEFPRRICVERFKGNKLLQFIGLPVFDIPRSVLDLVYGQTLCWIGAFFCPVIPMISVLKLLVVFCLKRASLLRNFMTSAKAYRASKTNSFFTVVLLVSFVLTTIPVGYSIGKIPPSQSCGPFRIYSSDTHYMFSAVGNLIHSWPREVGDIFHWLGSVSFVAPLIIVLCIAMYYYYIIASGHRKMIDLLKDQLAMEGRDKRFLIDRINETMLEKYGTAD